MQQVVVKKLPTILGEVFPSPTSYVLRDELEKNLSNRIRDLVDSEQASENLLLVTGDNGVGKTALIRHILQSKQFLEQCGIETLAWLNLGNTSDLKRIEFYRTIHKILKIANNERDDDESELKYAIQQHLKNSSRKTCFVIDDIEQPMVMEWTRFLFNSKYGKAICITSLAQFSVISAGFAKIHVPIMSDEMILGIVRNIIRSRHLTPQNSAQHAELLKRVVKVSHGIPLIARIISTSVWNAPNLDGVNYCLTKLEKRVFGSDQWSFEEQEKRLSRRETVQELILYDFGCRAPEFRQRFYFFLLVDEGTVLTLDDLHLLWQTDKLETAKEYSKMLANFTLIETSNDETRFIVHHLLYEAALRYVKNSETDPAIINGLEIAEKDDEIVRTLRINLIRSLIEKPNAKTGESLLHVAIKTKRELLTDVMLNHGDDELLCQMASQQTSKASGHELPLHCLLRSDWGLERACRLVEKLLCINPSSIRDVLTNLIDAQGSTVAKLLLDTTKSNSQQWSQNALFLSLALYLNKLLVFLLDVGSVTILKHSIDCDGSTALVIAAQYGNIEAITHLLTITKSPAGSKQTPRHPNCLLDVNARNRRGDSALLAACRLGDIDSVKILLTETSQNLDVNFKDAYGDAPLHLLAKFGVWERPKLMEAIDLLVQKGADINSVDSNGNTALLISIQRQTDVEVTKFMLSLKKINVKSPNTAGITPLWAAISNGSLEIAKMLKAKGADNFSDEEMFVLQKHASFRKQNAVIAFLISTMTKDTAFPSQYFQFEREMARLLNLTDCNYLAPKMTTTHRELMRHVYDGNLSAVKSLIVLKEICLEPKLLDAAFFLACYLGHLEIIQHMLLSIDSLDLNDFRNGEGFNALMISVANGHEQIVKVLMVEAFKQNKHFDLNAEIRETHETALHLAILYGHPHIARLLALHPSSNLEVRTKREGHTPLTLAADLGITSTVGTLALEAKADVNARTLNGSTALMLACSRPKQEEIISILVQEAKADINLRDEDGRTALMVAVEQNLESSVELLVQHSKLDVNMKLPATGDTALMMAVRKGDGALNVVRLLVEAGADARLENNNEGETAITLAKHGRHAKIAALLESIIYY